jgi:uncharacterized protein YbaR (Trm112 family)
MTDNLLGCLRCPLDPTRETPLTRDGQTLTCGQCAVTFPIKHGLPVLIADAATLPEGTREVSQLRCQRRENRRVNREK